MAGTAGGPKAGACSKCKATLNDAMGVAPSPCCFKRQCAACTVGIWWGPPTGHPLRCRGALHWPTRGEGLQAAQHGESDCNTCLLHGWEVWNNESRWRSAKTFARNLRNESARAQHNTWRGCPLASLDSQSRLGVSHLATDNFSMPISSSWPPGQPCPAVWYPSSITPLSTCKILPDFFKT